MTAVIDLGEGRGEVADDLPPRPRRTRAQLYRRVVLYATAVLLGLLGGAVAPGVPPLAAAGQVPVSVDDRIIVDGDRLIVVGEPASGVEAVSAFRLPGGHREWSSRVRLASVAGTEVGVVGGVVLVGRSGRSGQILAHTAAIDERTGAQLWTSGLSILAFREGTGALLSDGVSTLQAVDPHDGRSLWTYPLDPTCRQAVGAPSGVEHPTAFVELCTQLPPYQLRVVNLADGTVTASRPLEHGATTRPPLPWQLVVVDGVVIVEDNLSDPPGLRAYDLDGLRQIWVGAAYAFGDNEIGCGLDLCLLSTGNTIHVDPHTGALMGRLSPSLPLTAQVGVFQANVPAGVVGTLLLLGPGAPTPANLTDAMYAVGPVPERSTVSVPAFRPGRTWVVSAPAQGPRRTLQLLDGPSADACLATTRYLACMTDSDTLSLWRLPAL